MESIKAYLSMIDPRLLNQIKGKPKQFIELLKEQNYISEEVFASRICKGGHPRKYYRNLKSRTIQILQALALVSPSKDNGLVKKKYDFSQKNFAIGRKFLNKGERNEGLRLIKLTYRTAVEYDFLHLACESASILYHDSIYYHPNHKQASFYAEQFERLLQEYTLEKRIEHIYYEIIRSKRGFVYDQQLEKAIQLTQESKGKSAKSIAYVSIIQTLNSFKISDYQSVCTVSTNALQLLRNKKGTYSSHRQYFLSKKGIALLAIGQYRQAEASFVEAGIYTPAKSFNAAILHLYLTINALHAGQYKRAYELYQKNKKCRFELIRQQFAIIEAYFCFLSYEGFFQLEKPFRLGRYLNETFKSQSDKQGYNITILIAELLVYLAKDRGKFIDRIEAVKNYAYRHLKHKDTQRAKWFIKILHLIPRANFHSIELQKLAKKYIHKLDNTPICIGENVTITEMIPYHQLLNMMLGQAKEKLGSA